MTAPLAAVTGGTGFLGRYVVAALVAAGWRVRLLARRDPAHPLLAPVAFETVRGDLDDAAALSDLVRGASAVIHIAGLVKARSRREFLAVNRDGAARLAEIVAREAAAARFVLVSSQAARVPRLSAYAGSKRAGEAVVKAALGELSWVVVRPCVIYGPWGHEALALFRLARGPVAPRPSRPEPRIAMIHVRDAAAAIAALSAAGPSHATFEICDGRLEGYGWSELLREAGAVLGRIPRCMPVPDLLVRAAGLTSDAIARLGGHSSIFGYGKVSELLHRDWGSDRSMQPPATLWTPRLALPPGLSETLAWWREQPLAARPRRRIRSAGTLEPCSGD